MAIMSLDKLYNAKKKINELITEFNASGATTEPLRTIARSVRAEDADVAFMVIGDTLNSVSYLYNATTSIGYASLVPLTGELTSVVAPVAGVSLITVGGVNHYVYSLDVVDRYLASYNYAVTQLAGGVESKVGIITLGITVDSYDYLVYPDSGLIFSRGTVTGTTTGAFNPATGTAAGLTAPLLVSASSSIISFDQYAKFADRLVLGVDGGTAIAGVNFRRLNTTISNNIAGLSLIESNTDFANRDTLTFDGVTTDGEYYVSLSSVAYAVDKTKTALYDETNAAYIDALTSLSGYNDNASGVLGTSTAEGLITVTGETSFNLRTLALSGQTGNGLGVNSNLLDYEEYSKIEIWRIS